MGQHTPAYVSIRQPPCPPQQVNFSSTHQLLLLLLVRLLLLARVRALSEKHASLAVSLAVGLILLLRRTHAGALLLLCPRRMSAWMRHI
jgi:hypothetical protein